MSDLSTPEPKYRNFYKCPYDGTEWEDEWDSMCNDKCPECNKEIEPYHSEDIIKEEESDVSL